VQQFGPGDVPHRQRDAGVSALYIHKGTYSFICGHSFALSMVSPCKNISNRAWKDTSKAAVFWCAAGWNSPGFVPSRVPDPDPDWIRIQSGQWIRIRNPDPDSGGQKWPTHKSRKKKFIEVLDALFREL